MQGAFHNFVSTSRMPLGVFGQGAVVKEVLSRGHIVKCQKEAKAGANIFAKSNPVQLHD